MPTSQEIEFLLAIRSYVGDRVVQGAAKVDAARKANVVSTFERLVQALPGSKDPKHVEILLADMKTFAEGGGPTFPPPQP